ncbi:MAG: ABC-2 family transporter protein [Deltaproteobacteria bacterium ADurb.Bin058]|nr:MAG: ABC-2 family transporter protein [Deltaproteobacteria bacterium ADurb.Bin058]
MRNILVIARREFFAYFGSATAYIAIALFLALLGITFFFEVPFLIAKPAFFDARVADLRPLFEWMMFLFAILLPAISMRLLAEERKLGTLELLLTMPVTESEVVLGKLFGAVGFLLVALVLTLGYPLLVSILGRPDVGPIVGGYLGVLLVGTTYLALGLLASSWTSSQVVAFLLAIVISATFTFIDLVPEALGLKAIPAFEVLSFNYHFKSIARGVLDLRDIVFFVSIIIGAVMLTTWSLESRKWKGA